MLTYSVSQMKKMTRRKKRKRKKKKVRLEETLTMTVWWKDAES